VTTVSPDSSRLASAAPATPANLPLRQRPIDILFIVVFSLFIVTCVISDAIPTLGIPQTADSPNLLAQWNYWYSHQWDPLYQNPPLWLRFITGTSAFVYLPFYVILVVCLAKGVNGIQLFAVIYATMIISLTGIPIFGVEFFGPEGQRTPNPAMFLLYNGPYVLFPLLLLIRMRKPLPFTRRF
jgi:hypothetical protein